MVQRRKKTPKTNLTPSRKTQRRLAWLAKSRRLDALDEMSARCRRAIALADLLERCAGAEPLEASVVAGAGELILVEVRAMRVLLKIIWREETR